MINPPTTSSSSLVPSRKGSKGGSSSSAVTSKSRSNSLVSSSRKSSNGSQRSGSSGVITPPPLASTTNKKQRSKSASSRKASLASENSEDFSSLSSTSSKIHRWVKCSGRHLRRHSGWQNIFKNFHYFTFYCAPAPLAWEHCSLFWCSNHFSVASKKLLCLFPVLKVWRRSWKKGSRQDLTEVSHQRETSSPRLPSVSTQWPPFQQIQDCLHLVCSQFHASFRIGYLLGFELVHYLSYYLWSSMSLAGLLSTCTAWISP